ncbi:hypothetical protein [Deinococcus peraridilitoris]|uniref:Uncharacterized protein n=1 Tax=Deinococcus peraridilitoris (strain DSM 19664 / LMG 22246 / CIP 109416 / KR-200) TaxID=937777 RepID=L0A4L5_DEIPD|nr:hypothetical protein [Deinococcus peraridilitoris]AFZ67970.1 hypothetical protein Deipe_2502 [Deinococcus peraridilitoris DSM 19664]
MRSDRGWEQAGPAEQQATWQRLLQERLRAHLPSSRPAGLSQRQWMSYVVRACEQAEREATDELLFTQPRTYSLEELLTDP